MGKDQKRRGYRGEVILWALRGDVCDHGICIEDCDKCPRAEDDQKGEDNGKADDESC